MPAKPELTHYVEFFFPGPFVSESTTARVPKRTIKEAQKIPPKNNWTEEKPYSFRFFDRIELVTPDGETLVGPRKNVSGTYFLGGHVRTLGDIIKEMPDKEILISNMRANGWGEVIETQQGFLPFESRDKLIHWP